MTKTKKEITYRPMFGFSAKPKAKPDLIPLGPGFGFVEKAPDPKDALIAQLRASLALLEAKEEKRRIVSREAMRKKRAKSKA